MANGLWLFVYRRKMTRLYIMYDDYFHIRIKTRGIHTKYETRLKKSIFCKDSNETFTLCNKLFEVVVFELVGTIGRDKTILESRVLEIFREGTTTKKRVRWVSCLCWRKSDQRLSIACVWTLVDHSAINFGVAKKF